MKDNQAKYPQLRFKGFTDPWEQRKLSDAVDNIGTGKSKYMLQEKSDLAKYEVLGSTSVIGYDEDYDHEGDFILTARVGANAGNLYHHSGKVKITDNTVFIQGENLAFVYNLLTQFDLKKLSFGTGQPLVKASELKNLILYFPNNDEQAKIGSYFKQLDHHIALHQRKLAKLKELKQGYLQKMFPQNGSKFPQLRFAGFADAWEQRKLIEVADYRNGKAHEKDISENGDYIVVNSKFVSTNGAVKKFSDELIAPLKKGELAFVLSDVPNGRAIARTFLIDEDNKYSLNQRIAGITPHSDTNSYFLHSLMNRHHYFLRFDDGAGQTNLSKKEVENWTELYPSIEEQDKIGSFFKQLDDTITLHQRKLEKLQELKKGYLQKMFC